ncbi:unnamed protein product [Merluccius merluccius]
MAAYLTVKDVWGGWFEAPEPKIHYRTRVRVRGPGSGVRGPGSGDQDQGPGSRDRDHKILRPGAMPEGSRGSFHDLPMDEAASSFTIACFLLCELCTSQRHGEARCCSM